MSTRTTLRPQPVISAGDMSAVSITSAPTILQSLSLASYQLSWTGTSPVGVVTVQVSNDYALSPTGTVAVAGTWTNIYFPVAGAQAASLAVSGNTGNAFINLSDLGAYAVRLVYTKTSGVGSLTAIVNGKVL